jgi:hypothetical protein
MKKKLGLLSVILAAVTYGFLVTSTSLGTGEGLSLTTYALWSALAWITGFAMKDKADPRVVMVYGLGATSTTIVLLVKGRYGWTGLDAFVTILVVLCLVFWLTKGARWAIVLSVIAATIASIPFILMTWRKPEASPIIANSSFLLTNILALISAKAWTLEDRLYSVVNIIVCTILVIPIFPWATIWSVIDGYIVSFFPFF